MKCVIITALLTITFTSCNSWRIPDSNNKYLEVLKRDGNLTKTKARLAADIRIEALVQDTVTSSVSKGKAKIRTTTRTGVTIPENTNGDIVKENNDYFFVVKDEKIKKIVSRIPINVEKNEIFIITEKQSIDGRNVLRLKGTNYIVDNDYPGIELRIKEERRTESIKVN